MEGLQNTLTNRLYNFIRMCRTPPSLSYGDMWMVLL